MHDDLVPTRIALHAVAEQVLKALRVQETGDEIALRVVPGGIATPELPGGGWAGLAGTEIVRADPDGSLRRAPLTTLRAAAAHVGLGDAEALDDAPLVIDPPAATRLFGALEVGDRALAALLAGVGPEEEPSPVHLWPEHFDVAIELGAGPARANYGVSPGDADHAAPYAYVGPWLAPPAGPLWDATGFPGAEAPAEDVASVLAFWRERKAALG